jgi:hypothetical protein
MQIQDELSNGTALIDTGFRAGAVTNEVLKALEVKCDKKETAVLKGDIEEAARKGRGFESRAG